MLEDVIAWWGILEPQLTGDYQNVISTSFDKTLQNFKPTSHPAKHFNIIMVCETQSFVDVNRGFINKKKNKLSHIGIYMPGSSQGC